MPKKSGKINNRERGICSRVRNIRQEVRYSQSLFAKALGITRPKLAAIEYGHTPLRFSLATLLCSAFRTSPLWLANGEGPMHAYVLLPPPEQLEMSETSLFSEVFDKSLHTIFASLKHKSRDEIDEPSNDLSARLNRTQLICERLDDWIIEIPAEKMIEFETAVIKAIDDAGRRCGKDKWHSIALRQNAVAEAISRGKDASTGSAANVLTPNTEFRISADVIRKFTLPKLLEDLRRLTSPPGMKAKLAAHLKVPEARVYEWLKGKYTPSGDITLELLNWVQLQERK